MAINNLKKSKPETLVLSQTKINSMLVNSLREERVYLHYLRGDIGSSNSACGNRQHKLRKAGRSWEATGEVCSNGSQIFRIT